MKFCMNGARTIGTRDGANIEICNETGAENCFMFGLTAEEVHSLRRSIREYAEEIWRVKAVPIQLLSQRDLDVAES